jgi:hypothetical protein
LEKGRDEISEKTSLILLLRTQVLPGIWIEGGGGSWMHPSVTWCDLHDHARSRLLKLISFLPPSIRQMVKFWVFLIPNMHNSLHLFPQSGGINKIIKSSASWEEEEEEERHARRYDNHLSLLVVVPLHFWVYKSYNNNNTPVWLLLLLLLLLLGREEKRKTMTAREIAATISAAADATQVVI